MQKKNRFFSAVMAFMLLFGLLLAVGAAESETLEQQRSRLNRLQALIRQQRSRLSGVRQRESDARSSLQQTRGALQQTRGKLQSINSRLDELNSRLVTVRTELETAKARADRHQVELQGRLVRIYKHGRVSYLEVVLGAGDFFSFSNRLNFLRLVMRQDMNMLNDYLRQREALAAAEREIAAKETEIRRLHTQARQKERLYQAQAASQGSALGDIVSQRAAHERRLAELEANSRQVERMIQRIMNTPGGRRRSATAWSGGMILPVNGRISSPFGYRTHPIFRDRRMHSGVDFAVPSGTPIKAAAAGEVIFTGNFGGYGVTVIIDHGGGISTLYAHNSRVACHAGQRVAQGQVVAYSGNTGLSTGPHLHWEVRRNGTPVNPMGFVGG